MRGHAAISHGPAHCEEHCDGEDNAGYDGVPFSPLAFQIPFLANGEDGPEQRKEKNQNPGLADEEGEAVFWIGLHIAEPMYDPRPEPARQSEEEL